MFAFPSIEAATFFQAMFAVPTILIALRGIAPTRQKPGASFTLLGFGLAATAITWSVYLAAFLGPTFGWSGLTDRPFTVLWLPNAYLDTLLDSLLTVAMLVAILEHAHFKSQHANEQRILRVDRQQAATLKLAKDPHVAAGDLDKLIPMLNEVAAQTLDVDRVSIWIFNESRKQLICRDLFSRPDDSHTPRGMLAATDYPHYFAALENERLIDASDATTDPRTRELLHPYLATMGIGSMLDVSIRSSSNVIGVVCHEHLGGPRSWHDDEAAFAGFVADLVSQATANQRALEAEEQQQQLEHELRHSQKLDAVGHLASGIAHDFNNQLAVIMGYASLAEFEPDTDVREFLPQISTAAARAAELTRKLLSFSRRQVLRTQIVELNGIVANVSDLITRIGQANIHVVTNISDDVGCLKADPIELEQVLLNLANNAADAMPHGGTLTLETRVATAPEKAAKSLAGDRDWAVVTVRDTGTGIDTAHLEHIFEPFFTTKSNDCGTGLGLATSYGIVDQHDGHITVSSELGRGTVFEVWLPLVDLPATPEGATASQPSQRGAETILVVEDDASIRSLLKSLLTHAGYSVAITESGEEAVEHFRNHQNSIDLVILDTDLPGKSGPEALVEIRAIAPRTPAILTSGRGMDEHEPDFAVALPKPFSTSALLDAVRAALDAKVD